MQPADVMCVILGGNMPFILRPKHIKSNYRLLGDSYLHGMMYGEAVEVWLNSGIDGLAEPR
jgi:hypothetical protein